ncbi:MAG: fibronectin type III domain-containing protein [Burkholderiales bacterium]|nr:fibronectin type III domain-containing protein [Burkholderiales bacterium]
MPAPIAMHRAIKALATPAFLLRFAVLQVAFLCMPAAYAQTCTTVNSLGTLTPPTNVKQMIYSPTYGRLIVRNTGSAIALIDVATTQSTNRVPVANFADMAISPSGRYVFGADYGGENFGFGMPVPTSRVHRLDLTNGAWQSKTAYIAGGIQPVSDEQFILKSADQWVTFTNNAWGTGTAVVPLNTSSGSSYGPGYYAGVYSGDFRYDVNTGRLLHGSGLSSRVIQAFGLVGNDFVKREASSGYGTVNDNGTNVALATDASAFYYGRLQVDPLDVTYSRRVFAEPIYAATGSIAFGNGKFFDALNGNLMGSVGFDTTVYALNPNGQDFWAFDAGQNLLHHLTFASATCGIPPAPVGVTALVTQGTTDVVVSWAGIAGATGYNIYMAKAAGVTKASYASLLGGQSRLNVTSPHTALGLSAGNHYLVVTAYNASGESVESTQITINVPDVQAPTVPTGVTATAISSSRINISWNASTDNVGINYYQVYRGSSYLGSAYPPDVGYANTGLAGSTLYTYSVKACDSANNCSAPSATASATTFVSSTPNNFFINSKSNVPRSSVQVSDAITITGIGVPVAISVTAGEYSIDGGAFTANPGTIVNGQSVVVRMTSSPNYATQLNATLTVGGVSATFSVSTMAQTINPTQYFPLTPGNTWVMRRNGVSGTATITTSQIVNGVSTLGLQDALDGSTTYFSNDASLGLRQHRTYFPPGFVAGCGTVAEIDTYSSPVVILSPGFTLGQAYYSYGNVTTDSACGSLQFNYSTTSTFQSIERVTVPAGQFDAAKVRLQWTFSGSNSRGDTSDTYWLVAGIGIVKRVDGFGVAHELVSTNIVRTVPDEILLLAQSGAPPSSQVISGSVSITGITSAAAISITGGEYSINGGAFTSAAGSVINGQPVRIRVTASAAPATSTSATLTVGGVNGIFTVTSGNGAPTAPTAVSASTGYAAIRVTFGLPTNTGGAAITGYSATCTSSNGGVTASNTATAPATSVQVTGLSIGRIYTCTAAASNSVGTGSASAPSNAIKPIDLLQILNLVLD